MIPLCFLVLAILCWLWSHTATDRLVAWCRFMLAGFMLILGLIYAVMGAVLWVLG